MTLSTDTLTFDRIQHASDVLASRLSPTPLLRQALVDQAKAGRAGEIWLKCDSLQPTGSFKIRGATYRISQLTADERAAGVIAYSTGNHAQAVAKAAADAGIAATIVMSPDVPAAKIEATRRWGAKVVMAEPNSQARRVMAETLSASSGAILIPPYNDLDIMAGQGSIACELANQLGSLKDATLYVPIGGGGLLAGVATGIKAIDPSCRVIGVEPELEDDAARSFKAGHIIAAAGPSASIADAIKVQALGELTFPLIQKYVDDIVTVSEAAIAAAVLSLYEDQHLVVEPGGAVAYAAARRAAASEAGCHIALLCGGNISLQRLAALAGPAGQAQ
jgi:threonine dehydratase